MYVFYKNFLYRNILFQKHFLSLCFFYYKNNLVFRSYFNFRNYFINCGLCFCIENSYKEHCYLLDFVSYVRILEFLLCIFSMLYHHRICLACLLKLLNQTLFCFKNNITQHHFIWWITHFFFEDRTITNTILL